MAVTANGGGANSEYRIVDTLLGDCVGMKSRNAAKVSCSSGGSSSSSSSSGSNNGGRANRMVVSLTCLQFCFAMYGTFLLYFMSPALDVAKSEMSSSSSSFAWTSHYITKPLREFLPSSPRRILIDGARIDAAGTKNITTAQQQPPCESEDIQFEQKVSNDTRMLGVKHGLFRELMDFQEKTQGGCETLAQLMAMPSKWSRNFDRGGSGGVQKTPKVTVILNHFKRKTLCAQLDSLLHQTVPPYNVWVLAFGSPNEHNLRRIVEGYNDSRISFVGSTYDFKYYGRFQMALQADGADYVYILDDDMIPGRKMLEILTHTAGTLKYANAVLGSIGRVLPFRQKDFSFPSYRKAGVKEAGIYVPDPAYNIVMDKIMQVDFLSSSWFLSFELLKTIFIETPFTFSTGEDLHLSYQLQKYRDGGSFVLPIDPNDKDTWGDSEHRLAYVSETTVIFKDVIRIRDDQWWRTLVRGYVTQWASMHPQQIDALIYAHSLHEVVALAPLIQRFRSLPGRKAFVVVSGGAHCPCEEAAAQLGWAAASCHDRRFKIFDLEVGSIDRHGVSDVAMMQEVYSSMKGLLKIHNPALVIAVDEVAPAIKEALRMAVDRHGGSNANTSLLLLPTRSAPYAQWIADVKTAALQKWSQMQISINVVTQNRAKSLNRLLKSLSQAYYVGDRISLSFNMDSKVDPATLNVANRFEWPHGAKTLRRRIIQGGLIRAVSESWYPASDDDFGLLLEDDIEVSPFFYMWLKYALLAYHYDPSVSLGELNAIALYTPRLVEVVKERPKWNATEAFKSIHPNTPYLHQLPCSWGALFFPKHWREFYTYMGMRFTEDAKSNPVQIPKSRTNGWQASWKKFLIDLMYLRGYVTLYPNFPNQTSFSTNHMEPGAHIAASNNAVNHLQQDFEVPLMQQDFRPLLPLGKMPSASRLPVVNLFNQPSSLKGLKSAGARLGKDVIECKAANQVVIADHVTGQPLHCNTF